MPHGWHVHHADAWLNHYIPWSIVTRYPCKILYTSCTASSWLTAMTTDPWPQSLNIGTTTYVRAAAMTPIESPTQGRFYPLVSLDIRYGHQVPTESGMHQWPRFLCYSGGIRYFLHFTASPPHWKIYSWFRYLHGQWQAKITNILFISYTAISNSPAPWNIP